MALYELGRTAGWLPYGLDEATDTGAGAAGVDGTVGTVGGTDDGTDGMVGVGTRWVLGAGWMAEGPGCCLKIGS